MASIFSLQPNMSYIELLNKLSYSYLSLSDVGLSNSISEESLEKSFRDLFLNITNQTLVP